MNPPALARYDALRNALQLVVRVDEAKDIKDKAVALEIYARQQHDVEMERWVSEIKLRAVMRIGELSKELEKMPAKISGAARGRGLPTAGKTSKSSILKAAGISTSAAQRAERLAEHATEVEAYIAAKLEQREVIKFTEVMYAIEAQAREAKAKEELMKKSAPIVKGLHVGDFRKLSHCIADESVQLVFTDPPYDRGSIPLFGDAAKEAARILRPGGSFIAYCGQIQLLEVYNECSKHLRYWWTHACFHSGRANEIRKYGIKNTWKPLVWFVKETRGDVQAFVNDSVTSDREKDSHPWQQAESEAAYYIEKLTSPSGIVVDFFAGGGTTLAACEKLGRPWIAFEIDPACARRASERLKAP